MKTELKEFARRRDTNGPYADHVEVDALIVGAGFSGIYMLYQLRKLGLKSVIYEAGTDIGGTWRWNRYPGACVDSQIPAYEYSIPEVWKDWTWKTNYPDWKELCTYFDHVEKVLSIKEDCAFETVVVDAQFFEEEGKWHVRTQDGRLAKCKYFIVAVGSTAKRYIPNFKGLDSFQGVIHHAAFWPEEDVDMKGKRVAVIGTGPTGLQVIQELAPNVKSMTVFQRTPVIALPINRRSLTAEEQQNVKEYYPTLFRAREQYFSGFPYGFSEKLTFDDSPEEQEALFESLWGEGGFKIWQANYKDVMIDPKANRHVYDFWAKKVRARIGDPAKRDLLAPLEPPHPFGAKRPCLEQNYYEQFNRPNVDLVDISNNPIQEFKPTGIILSDGTLYESDIIVLCTGFDVTTGGMTNMGLRSINGTTLQDEWANGANTYLGITVRGYPNMFHLFGTHAPGLISNAPAGIEIQGRFVADVIKKMERERIKYINPTTQATETWKQHINLFFNATLFSTTKSNFTGGNLPGKPFEPVNFLGGMVTYANEVRAIFPDLKGFDVVKATRRKYNVIS